MLVLQDGWPRLADIQWYCWTAGLGWLVFSILQDGGLCWFVYGSFYGRVAYTCLCSVVLYWRGGLYWL